jgi:hypothetical protein
MFPENTATGWVALISVRTDLAAAAPDLEHLGLVEKNDGY